MIHVLATINLKTGTRAAFLKHLMANVPAVLAEQGCHGYTPAIDIDSGLAAQGPLREKVKDMVDSVKLQVLQSA